MSDKTIEGGPRARYQRDLKRADFVADPAQVRVVDALEELHHALMLRECRPVRRHGLLGGLLRRNPPPSTITGLYLWGAVGRGKTYLMDCFFDSLCMQAKLRTHFYRFMRQVHDARKRHRHEQDPLDKIGAELATQARVLCFDEFFVSDIADAMILGGILQALFARGVTVVTTSNVAPDDLYRNGLQRARFLPTIELIKRHMRPLRIDDGEDFRLHLLQQDEVYLTPLGAAAESSLRQTFDRLASTPPLADTSLRIQGRDIACRRLAGGIAWFDFEALVGGRRSASDYVELAHRFHTVLVSDIPVLDRYHENDARRFVSLVDEFYDRRVHLILSAAASIDLLYQGKRLTLEFERTRSRLQEMRSRAYLKQPHLA